MGLTMSNKEVVFSNFLFPEDLVHMISVWEETWSVWKTIQRVWEIYQSELKSYISNLMTMLEPIIIVTVWALVGTIVIAIMLPFFAILKVVKKM
jgi:type II secretory pathway component PulF